MKVQGARSSLAVKSGTVLALLGLSLAVAAPVIWGVTRVLIETPRAFLPTSAHAVINTFLLATFGTFLCVVSGAICAFVFDRAKVPMRRFCVVLLTIPLLLPPHVVAISLCATLGGTSSYVWTPPGMSDHPLPMAIWVVTVCYMPLVMWILRFGLQMIPREQEELAALYMSSYRVGLRITGPHLKREIAVGAVLVFMIAMQCFDICSIVGLDTLMTEVYLQAAAMFSTSGAIAAAGPILMCGLAGAAFIARFSDVNSTRVRRRPVQQGYRSSLSPTGFLASAACLSLLVAGAGLPLWNLAMAGGDVGTLWRMWQEGARGLLLSAEYAGGAVAVMLGLTILLIPAATHPTRTVRRATLLLLLIPFAVPSSVLSICMLDLFDRPPFAVVSGFVDGVPRIVAILGVRYLFLFVLIVTCGWSGSVRRGDELAAVHRVSRLARWRYVRWPLVRPYVAVAGAISFALAMRELELYILHAPPGAAPLPVRIFNVLHFGPPTWTASLCILLAFAAATPILLVWSRRGREATLLPPSG